MDNGIEQLQARCRAERRCRVSEFQNPVQLLADLVHALDYAYISPWQSTAAWRKALDAARAYIDRQKGGAE